MFSYIFMKILESRPHRYDRGIDIITGGHASRVKQTIVDRFVKPGTKMLDLGCGTGSLAVMAAKKGASVTGVDISEGMLAMARQRIATEHLESQITLFNKSVVEIEGLFEPESFDVIASTLVISELYHGERHWTLQQIKKLLAPNGVLVLAGEVRPPTLAKRLLYHFLRFPLAVLTYVLSQSSTKAVPDMAAEVAAAGFTILSEERSFLGSFTTVVSKLPEQVSDQETFTPVAPYSDTQDISLVKSVMDYLLRWFPNPVEPGLRVIGSPDRSSPVIVTCNFHLTVRRVERALKGLDCFLLVAPSNGINVWCASSSKEMNSHSVLSVIKTSGIAEKVDHRRLILPQLSAVGIDPVEIRKQSRWKVLWGPVYIRDIKEFISQKFKKTEEQSRVSFPLLFRLEMLISMNMVIWFAFALILLLFNRSWIQPFTILFWAAALVMYAGYDSLPTESGWGKAFIVSVISLVGFLLAGHLFRGDIWAFKGWMIVAVLSIMSIGFDLKGIASGSTSEAEAFMHTIGFNEFGALFKATGVQRGAITKDMLKCINCRTCRQVCPKGVFGTGPDGKKMVILNDHACIECSACVQRCPEGALTLNPR